MTWLRKFIRFHLDNQLALASYDIGVHLVSSERMAEVNRTHLHHEGPTDVITFDYCDPGETHLHGDLFICPAIAHTQADEHGTSWESEILRYLIHGILHLRGYDDLSGNDRRVMKREENRLLKGLVERHPASQLSARRVSCKRPLE